MSDYCGVVHWIYNMSQNPIQALKVSSPDFKVHHAWLLDKSYVGNATLDFREAATLDQSKTWWLCYTGNLMVMEDSFGWVGGW